MADDARTTETLRATLFDAIADVKSGKMDHLKGRTIAALAGQIVASAAIEIAHAKLTGLQPKTIALAPPVQKVDSIFENGQQ